MQQYRLRYNIDSQDLIQIYMDFALEQRKGQYRRSGCYAISHELMKKYENKDVLVPLVASEYVLEIANTIANVTMSQTYQNPTDKFLQMEYSFPINPNICVYRFVAEFGKTRIEGIVKEKKEAEKAYKEAVSEGKKAAFGSINADNNLNMKVGNVPPNEQVKIQIVYLQELSLCNNTFYQLKITGSASPRYLNHIPKEAIINSYGNQAKPGSIFRWNFKIYLRTTRKVIFSDSNTHPLLLVAQNDTKTISQFRLAENSLPNNDFVFTYTTQNFEIPSHVFGRTDHSSSAMISFIPKFCSLALDDAYKASITGKTVQCDIQDAIAEFVFFLDRSGSMMNQRIKKAKQSLILFIKSLPRDSYFNVISFGSSYRNLFPTSVKYLDDLVDEAISKIEAMEADLGGTEIYKPLLEQLQGKLIDGYPRQIFLLTDGEVDNINGVIKMVGENNKYSRVHTIGIGGNVSKELIVGCANKGKGHHIFIGDSQNPSQKIIQLLSDSLSPVISKMNLTYNKDIVQSIIPNPQSIPYILKDEMVNFYINFKGQLDKPTALTFTYQDSISKMPYTSHIQISPDSENESFIDKMGIWKKINILEQSLQSGKEIQDYIYYVKVLDKKEEIISQSVQHQILSKHTAFVCVEKELVDGKFQEVNSVGKSSGVVRAFEPEKESDDEQVDEMYEELLRQVQSSKQRRARNVYCAPKPRAVQQQKMAMRDFNKQSMLMDASLDQILSGINTMRCSGNILQQQLKEQSIKLDSLLEEKEEEGVLTKMGKVFGSIGSSISSIFSKSDKPTKDKKQSQFKAPQPQVQQKKESIPRQEQSNKQQKGDTKAPSTSSLSIDKIISQQSTNGSWKDLSLIISLYGQEVKKRVEKQSNPVAVITFLVARWIEKHYPSKQYNLLLKKAWAFIKENGDLPNISKEYEEIIQ